MSADYGSIGHPRHILEAPLFPMPPVQPCSSRSRAIRLFSFDFNAWTFDKDAREALEALDGQVICILSIGSSSTAATLAKSLTTEDERGSHVLKVREDSQAAVLTRNQLRRDFRDVYSTLIPACRVNRSAYMGHDDASILLISIPSTAAPFKELQPLFRVLSSLVVFELQGTDRDLADAQIMIQTTAESAPALDLDVERQDYCPHNTFPIELNNHQCFGLEEIPGVMSMEQCRETCCEDEGCSVWQYCPGGTCGSMGCWVGELSKCGPSDGWFSEGRQIGSAASSGIVGSSRPWLAWAPRNGSGLVPDTKLLLRNLTVGPTAKEMRMFFRGPVILPQDFKWAMAQVQRKQISLPSSEITMRLHGGTIASLLVSWTEAWRDTGFGALDSQLLQSTVSRTSKVFR